MPIDTQRSYLQKHRYAPRQIPQAPSPKLGMVIVIPCHREPDLFPTLRSLEACTLPQCDLEVLLVFNSGKNHHNDVRLYHTKQIQETKHWITHQIPQLSYHCLHFGDLSKKHAGVGLARKIGMDEAVDRLEQVKRADGIIVCLDGDTLVQPNYLQEIEAAFTQDHKLEALSIDFAHPLEGKDHPPEIYAAITQYELFLRYYIEALRFAGFPYAYHTIGSAMAVRSSAYQKRGGMNRRKAGEDFYFLHKFIPEGRFAERQTTKVIPSPRPSDRVPFGTGRAISQWLDQPKAFYPAYAPESFIALKQFLDQVPSLYHGEPQDLDPSLLAFGEDENLHKKLPELRENVKDATGFPKRFYSWFDALKVLKYVHFARDHFYPDIPVEEAASRLWKMKYGKNLSLSTKEWLLRYREVQSS
ncbi:MAG: glycosyltransferase family 2 protein [Bacteroidota bacterium]